MGNWLSRLFGSGGEPSKGPDVPSVDHKGFTIRPTPRQADGQWQVVGVITKEIDGEVFEETFIRADKCGSSEEAVEITLRKGRQLIDEQGDRLFRP
ncbi:hypothetical protein H2509_01410 [Stappia sp. F7233]|uniref:Transcriptional activator HlyU n=1 Tax=Stappia albiluteola TaxID=2758565 RepID=A0A839A9Q4_9HYPH|nr:hypothetical protein [Stappia albiluteola]